MISAPHPWRWLWGGAICAFFITLGVDRWLLVSNAPAPGAASDPAPVLPLTPPSATWSLDQAATRAEVAARIASWLALDPTVSPYAERALGLRALLVVADAGQLAALADRLARRGGEDDARWFETVFARWIELDAASATRWTSALGVANRLPVEAWAKARETAALAWARATFDPAYAWALAEPDAGHPEGIAARLLGWLAETDPARALALGEARGAEAMAATLRPIFDAWAKRDPEAALRALGPRLLSSGARVYDLSDALKGWFQKSPEQVFAWMAEHPLLAAFMDRDFAGRLGSDLDRNKSADMVLKLADPDLKYRLLRGMLTRGGSSDQEGIAKWIGQLEDPDLRARLVRDANQITFVGATERNLPLALLMPPGAEREARLVALTTDWAGRDPAAALAWLNDHGEASVSLAVQAAALGGIARDEPQTALATWASLPAGAVRDGAAAAIAKGWAQKDPVQAAEWWAAQDAAREGKRDTPWETAQAIMDSWTARDADAALAWAEVRLGTARDDNPLYAWARAQTARLSAEQAIEQVARISSAGTRNQTIYNIVHPWLRRDPAGAEKWLTQQAYLSSDNVRAWIEEARKDAAR